MAIQRHDSGPLMSQAVVHGDTVYLAGKVAKDLAQDVAGQTRQILDNIQATLNTVGSDKSKLLSATIWLKDIKDRDAMNEVWTSWADADNLPARACVQAEMARPEVLVEIMVTAAR